MWEEHTQETTAPMVTVWCGVVGCSVVVLLLCCCGAGKFCRGGSVECGAASEAATGGWVPLFGEWMFVFGVGGMQAGTVSRRFYKEGAFLWTGNDVRRWQQGQSRFTA